MTLPRPSLRRIWRGLRAWSFELRLAGALLGTFVVVMAVAHAVTAQTLRDGLIELDAAHYTGEARSIEAAFAERHRRAAAGGGARGRRDAGAPSRRRRRPAPRRRGKDDRRIEPDLIGRRETSPAISAALMDGRAYSGGAARGARGRGQRARVHRARDARRPELRPGGRCRRRRAGAPAGERQREHPLGVRARGDPRRGALLPARRACAVAAPPERAQARHARSADRPRQPPRVPGGARPRALVRRPAGAGRWRSSTSTTSSSPTTRRAIATGTRCSSRSGVRFWPGAPRTAPSVSAATSSR